MSVILGEYSNRWTAKKGGLSDRDAAGKDFGVSELYVKSMGNLANNTSAESQYAYDENEPENNRTPTAEVGKIIIKVHNDRSTRHRTPERSDAT